jgi:hypothetical protein
MYVHTCIYENIHMYEGAEERQGFICFSLPLCVCVPCVIIYYKKLFIRLGRGRYREEEEQRALNDV